MKILGQMQRKAAIWITGAFRTSPTGGVQAIAGLLPIHLHIQKLSWRASFRTATLSDTHPARSLMGAEYRGGAVTHDAAISELVCEGVGNRLDEGTWDPANPVVVWMDGRPPSLRKHISIAYQGLAS